ncbi:MAG: proprotein convertase P-domain-containing protein, partial [Candidatus Omnitrophica bacterium]|nr:proprotein convertase P-domain-containing protein [Candidatus Omnitrophota bacterium]
SGFVGTDTFTYRASDGTDQSNEATVTVIVNSAGGTETYTNTTKTNIIDRGICTSTIVIGDNYSILDLNVKLNITHTRDSDLQVFLIGPDGTRIQLFANIGGTGQNFQNTILDDEAATSIANGTAPFDGTYKPMQSLSAFDGKLTKGTWTIEVRDTVKKMTGTLDSWSLIIEH